MTLPKEDQRWPCLSRNHNLANEFCNGMKLYWNSTLL